MKHIRHEKSSKRGLRIIASLSTVILMSPLFANSSVQVMLGNELNAHADAHAKTPEGDKSVHKAFTPKRKSQHAIDSSIKYSHKVSVLKVSLKPTATNYFKKGDQIHFKFSSRNVNLKNLKASYQKSLPFSYKRVNDHELVLTFKKSLNSGLYGQAYAIPTKNRKMTTKVKGTFDNTKLNIKNDDIHSYQLASRAHKASSNAAASQTLQTSRILRISKVLRTSKAPVPTMQRLNSHKQHRLRVKQRIILVPQPVLNRLQQVSRRNRVTLLTIGNKVPSASQQTLRRIRAT